MPAWHSGLTVKQSEDIERGRKVALQIILGVQKDRKASYDMAMVILDIEPLFYRREKLCLSFAKKTLKSRHSELFKPSTQNTRNRPMFYEHKSNKTRCYNSPLNYLTRLLNLNWIGFNSCLLVYIFYCTMDSGLFPLFCTLLVYISWHCTVFYQYFFVCEINLIIIIIIYLSFKSSNAQYRFWNKQIHWYIVLLHL